MARKRVRVVVVMLPQHANLVLTTNIPDGELEVFVLDVLDIEANRGDGSDELVDCAATARVNSTPVTGQ